MTALTRHFLTRARIKYSCKHEELQKLLKYCIAGNPILIQIISRQNGSLDEDNQKENIPSCTRDLLHDLEQVT